jgi:signal transduction histidine kinase
MLVDTQPATYQHVPASPEVRDHWVNSQLIGVLMDNMGPSLLAGVLSLPVLVYLMAGQANTIALAVWASLTLVMLVMRYRLIGIYRLRHDSLEGPQRMNFVERYQWSWTAMALLWGGPVLLSYQQSTQATQFVCGLVVLGQGLLTLTAFSAYLPVFRQYANALIFSVFVGLAWNTLWMLHKPEAVQIGLVLMALLFVFWGLLIMAGRRLHEVHRSSFELQFSNQELIDSLTLQTRASLRAVATKNRFLASAAHDLRQPVHALSLYADWLATEPEMARDIAPRILQSTRAINELFDSLFDLTRIDAGNYKVPTCRCSSSRWRWASRCACARTPGPARSGPTRWCCAASWATWCPTPCATRSTAACCSGCATARTCWCSRCGIRGLVSHASTSRRSSRSSSGCRSTRAPRTAWAWA